MHTISKYVYYHGITMVSNFHEAFINSGSDNPGQNMMAKTQKFPHSPYINAISAIETTHMAQKSTDIGGRGISMILECFATYFGQDCLKIEKKIDKEIP